ncbi:MAG TPA: DUF5667 domain-containing protein [Mycobacteriales bacterium]|jgi:hypothetical protein|nr:DUF5667 domain-containing protein [Mycobacteriales bacterium]
MRRQASLAQEFAAALEGRGVASARRDPALAPLLALAQGLQTVPLAAAPDFRDSLRQRLLAVATVAPAPVEVPSPLERARTWVEGWRVQKAISVMAASMAAVVGLTGVSVAASRSLPGDALYGVKRTAEGVQVSLARNDVNRGKRHLQHAETRLHEVGDLVGSDVALAPPPAPGDAGPITVAFGGSKSERVSSALRAMDADTRTGTKLLFDAYVADRDEDVLRVVRDFSLRQRDRLNSLIDELPADAHDEAQAALALVGDLNVRATQLLSVGACGDQCAPVKPPAPRPGDTAPTALPTATPNYDDLGPVPCTCPADPTETAAPEPTPDPQPQPTPAPTTAPEPTPRPTPTSPPPTSSQPSHYPLPSQIPSPVASPLQTIADEVNETLPTPLPTLPPLPVPGAPLVPGGTTVLP